jgi:hypothetical protein
MKLTYETAKATLIQFIVIGVLNIADALQSIITTCLHNGNACVGNLLSSVIYYVLIIIWFGIILALGASAQSLRSKKLARLLICAELAVFVVAGYNIRLNIPPKNGYLSLITSLVDVALSVWVMRLAYNLTKAQGGRLVKGRQRKPRKPIKHS